MKFCILFLSIISVIEIQAQEFKPYKVKSGNITYEKLKYSTISGYSYKNGVETNYSKQVPYVAEQVIYYWDEFGDIAFEEKYQVSEFGGKLLPEKVKIAEQLWADEHLYYFNFEENKVNDEPDYLRIEYKENFQIKETWIETLYGKTEKAGTEKILGKQTNYYTIDAYQDIYVWKGLVLKDESFATTLKGERLHPSQSKIAVDIDTISEINKELFNPTWFKRENLYQSLGEQRIVELFDGRQELLEQADNIKGIELKKNDILLFVTSKLTIGKMQVLEIDENNQLVIKYSLYSYGKIINGSDSFKIKNNSAVNIDNLQYKIIAKKELDFEWKATNKGTLVPLKGSYSLLKPSRSKLLEIKAFVRNNKQ
jgi:hypothetical protein